MRGTHVSPAWTAAVALLTGCGLVGYGDLPGEAADASTVDGPLGLCDSTTDLAGWYRLDETDPLLGVRDSSGNDRGATCDAPASCPSATVNGFIGGALSFDGAANQRLRVSSPAAFSFESGYTLSAFVLYRTASPVGVDTALGKRVGSEEFNSWQLGVQLEAEEVDAVLIADSLTERFEVRAGVDLVAQAWTHLATTWTGPGGSLSLYVNGALAAESPPGVDLDFDGGAFLIGADPDNTVTNPFDGNIDDVRVYDRALGAREIAALAACR